MRGSGPSIKRNPSPGALRRPLQQGEVTRVRASTDSIANSLAARHTPAIPRRVSPGLRQESPLPQIKRAQGNAGCALHPRSRVQNAQTKRTRAYRFSGGSPAFPAQWFYGLLRALPGDRGFFVTVTGGKFSRRFDASVEASGPLDFAVRVSAVRHGHLHVHRIPHPTSVTTAKRPSC